MLGLGPRLFVKDSMNVFDAVVVFFSLIEILDLLKRFGDGGVKILPLSVLRAFRIIRLFKLARSIESMRKILATLISSMASVMYLGMLLGLIILIFILLGMELFGGRYPRPELNFTKVLPPLGQQVARRLGRRLRRATTLTTSATPSSRSSSCC